MNPKCLTSLVRIAALLAIYQSSLLSAGVTQEDLLFYASFDKGIDADFSRGIPAAEVKGEAPVFKDGKIGKGLLIGAPGASVTYVSDENLPACTGSVSLWVKSINWTLPDNHFHVFFESFPYLIIYSYHEGNALVFYASPDGTSKTPAAAQYTPKWSTGEWSPENWHHIAATWQDGSMRLYVDGEVKGMARLSFPLKIGVDFTVGAHPKQKWPYTGSLGEEPLTVVDELKIFRRALTEEDIAEIFLAK